MDISERISMVEGQIASAAIKAGRKADEITLVAVSKFQSIEAVNSAAECGIKNFGENYVQEFCDKYSHRNDLKWHIIGNLQTNKVKYVIGKNALIETVDRPEVASRIDELSKKMGVVSDVLLQVNTCGEETKSGVSPDELMRLYDECLKYDGMQVLGLMTIGPNTQDEYQIEKCYEQTYALYEKMKDISKDCVKMLSMGMSHDYKYAIMHGANIVRIGRAIFGERSKR